MSPPSSDDSLNVITKFYISEKKPGDQSQSRQNSSTAGCSLLLLLLLLLLHILLLPRLPHDQGGFPLLGVLVADARHDIGENLEGGVELAGKLEDGLTGGPGVRGGMKKRAGMSESDFK